MDEPKSISLTAVMDITAGADAGDPGAPTLPRFSMVAYTGGAMRIAGWRYPVVLDLAGLVIPSQARPIRFGHDMTAGVGHTDSIRVADGKLLAAGVVSRDTPAAREIVASGRNGFPWQASVGATVEQFEFVREAQAAVVNGREFKGPVNVVRKATLGEISFVDLGADANSSASVAASGEQSRTASANQENGNMDGNENTNTDQDTTAVADQGRDASNADAQAAGKDAGVPAIESAATKSAPADDGITADPVADMRAEAATEQERIAAVRKVCGDKHGEICAKAIKEGSIEFEMLWDPDDAGFAAIQTAWANAAEIAMAAMDGPIATSGSQGLASNFTVTNFSRNEPLEEAVTVSVTIKPSSYTTWYEVT